MMTSQHQLYQVRCFSRAEPAGPEVPLRASRSVFLPLWNNVDYSGDAWREAPPPEESDEEEEGRVDHF